MRYIRVAIAKLRGKPIPPDISTQSYSNFEDPNAPPPPPPRTSTKKPLIIFLLAVFGLPYLMGKLIRAMAQSQPHTVSSRPFDPSTAQFYRATFDFIPRNAATEVPLRRGDVVAVIHRTDGGWWRARLRDGREGYVPSTYLEQVHNPGQPVPPIVSPPGEKGHAFIEEFKDE
jgi:peroxin-13